ncbi:MAG: transglutaminase family protein [Pseudomonadales bacterium]|nr:transglutaminase family protein [Pseudomonadales bacterium]
MTIRVAIRHLTDYQFDKPIKVYPHVLRLRPAPHCRTKIHGYSLKITPEDHFLNWQQDPFGNYQARLVFPEKVERLSFEVEVIADMTVINPFDFFVEEDAKKFPFEYDEQLSRELKPYLEVKESGPLLKKWVDSITDTPEGTVDFLVYVNQMLEQQIDYGIRMEPGIQTCEETLTLKKGSCRDTAWLLIQILRHMGLAARFASGYLVQLKPDVKSLDGPSGAEEDFTDLHAWCEVFVPGAGWIGLDPTSGLLASEGHIPLACTADPVSAAPITGATDECEVEFDYANEVFRIHEDPRVTKPYTDEQWQTIMALGNAVDSTLVENDVRLTIGGEPTFVSIDDMESAQWNTAALGADKLRLAKDLLLRLRDRFAPSGLLHYGQGKWYPGEELPRWALGCFWRKDGEALWQDPQLLARVDKDYGFDNNDAKLFIKTLAQQLGLGVNYVQPVYEDTLYYLWKEQSLPKNIDPLKANLKDSLERRRIARVLKQGLDEASGYLLPVSWDYANQDWCTSNWPMRNERILLIPGDSPIGLRLPLDSLPYVTEIQKKREFQAERDPFEPRDHLGEVATYYNQTLESVQVQHEQLQQMMDADEVDESYFGDTVRTAICAEAREGKIHIFLPPLHYLEHYVQLIHTIEKVAAHLKMPVVLEGYEPPKDARLCSLLVTPDPGVIEVNIHPAKSWKELVHNTEVLYEQAYQSRLGTEKFMLDGRHTGTGGGNHVTLGGATPADSPFLRRPDLLRSFVTYWQNHPGLSYLFSGIFIGPTSQAPRADEGRAEMLYELEIAFQQMPEGEVAQPWLVDRLMRNLLIDITGNTHRAEFCIDKLYSPGSASGRQGLLEFRGFEMPPHHQMSLVQMLLIRSLVARFWKQPYKQSLVRWGTNLHDRFMLPHFVWQDLKEVVQDLNDFDIPFQLEWLAPFEEFRFPHYGRVQIDDVNIELRWAIEPWHVLGEEVTNQGTARFVDSSVERLQAKVTGINTARYVLACNGRRVPLQATGKHEEYVAGVRYRAWQPPSALHPTIGIQVPLVFDLIDTWTGKSIGGCTYHVAHPGGRGYDIFPVNAFEAEARRGNRFWDFGHTPGTITPRPFNDAIREFFPNQHPPRPMAPPPEEPASEYPHTLDLRRIVN